ncbi:MAG TPA: hypothetical protein VEC94_08395 [Pseudolabrys sp.]|nr:hypothetical protein [Pseudolabrys sp.]
MNIRYSHTQTGRLLRLAALLPVPFFIVAVIFSRDIGLLAVAGPLIAIVAIAGVVFSSLTIEIDNAALNWWFGLGVWKRQIALGDVASAAVVRNPWWYGFGIHRTPRGWLYNVSGLDAVEICLHDGRIVRLGTNEPRKLVDALKDR